LDDPIRENRRTPPCMGWDGKVIAGGFRRASKFIVLGGNGPRKGRAGGKKTNFNWADRYSWCTGRGRERFSFISCNKTMGLGPQAGPGCVYSEKLRPFTVFATPAVGRLTPPRCGSSHPVGRAGMSSTKAAAGPHHLTKTGPTAYGLPRPGGGRDTRLSENVFLVLQLGRFRQDPRSNGTQKMGNRRTG